LRYFITLISEYSNPQRFSREQARIKAERYCAYQERSQHEVRSKLYEWGQYSRDAEEIISELIQGNFLNEERFAQAYAQGKFRIKGWGKIRIKQGLKLKKVPEPMILKVLKSIDPDDYREKLRSLLDKKSLTVHEKDPYKKRSILLRYAASKGYEQDIITDMLAQ